LQPKKDDYGQPAPVLLRLSPEAKAIYVAFYNECGDIIAESDEREAAAWSKLTGYGARFALLGQVLSDTEAEEVTGEIMQAACDLARWSGNETARIYRMFSETTEEREQRELIEFVQRHGGEATVRETMQKFWPLRNQRDVIERYFARMVRAGLGRWIECKSTRGPAARKFQLLRVSTSTGFSIPRGKTAKPVDVDVPNPF
jgi:hypothetical protein